MSFKISFFKNKMEVKKIGNVKNGYYIEEIEFKDNVSLCTEYHEFLLAFESWYKNGKRHRDNDLPAFIRYNKNGNILKQTWFRNGNLFRDNNQPTCIIFYESGELEEQKWENDRFTRRNNDQPCVISYYKNGNKKEEKWSVDFKRETLDENGNRKPDAILYNENGNIEREVWDENNIFPENIIAYCM